MLGHQPQGHAHIQDMTWLLGGNVHQGLHLPKSGGIAQLPEMTCRCCICMCRLMTSRG